MSLIARVTRVACPTSTGNQDITISGFGTPKAALFIVTQATADGTAADHAQLMVGATDGTNQWAAAMTSENGLTTTDDFTGQSTAACVNILDPAGGSADGVAAFSAWITNGVRINWSNAPASAYLMTVVLFGGSDLSAYAGALDMADTVGSAVSVTGVGFRPTDLITVKVGYTSTHRPIAVGVVHDESGTESQGYVGIACRDGQTTTLVGGISSSTMASGYLTGAVMYTEAEILDFGADGFDCYTRDSNTGATVIYFLALRITTYSSWKGAITTPTSTGNQAQTGPGFKPQFVMQLMSGCQSADSLETSGLGATMGISVADASAQYSNSIAIEDGVTTSNAESLSDNQMAVLHADDGSASVASTFVSFDANGWTQNFTAVSATGKIWQAWAIEAGGLSIPIVMYYRRARG